MIPRLFAMSMKKYKEKLGIITKNLWARWKLPACKEHLSILDWEELDKVNKEAYPVRYFLQETIPLWFYHKRIKYVTTPWDWVRFRTVSRHHVIKLTDMRPHWADSDHIMLMANFQILRDFVEERMAQTNDIWWREGRPKGMPTWIWDKVQYNSRSAPAGLDHLEQQIEFYKEQGLPFDHVEAIIDLYLWWTEGYLKRIDAWSDDRIWAGSTTGDSSASHTYHNWPNQQNNGHSCSAMAGMLDGLYDDEEQAMLERLVALRLKMWY